MPQGSPAVRSAWQRSNQKPPGLPPSLPPLTPTSGTSLWWGEAKPQRLRAPLRPHHWQEPSAGGRLAKGSKWAMGREKTALGPPAESTQGEGLGRRGTSAPTTIGPGQRMAPSLVGAHPKKAIPGPSGAPNLLVPYAAAYAVYAEGRPCPPSPHDPSVTSCNTALSCDPSSPLLWIRG